VLWLILFIAAGVLVFHPYLFGLDLYPLALLLVVALVITYEGHFRRELEKLAGG